jgi:hypothetical protein
MEEWWLSISHGLPQATAAGIDKVFHHAVELTRNALESSDEVVVIASISVEEVILFFTDNGSGIDPVFALNHSRGGGFGFRRAFRFADCFVVEAKGLKFSKMGSRLVRDGPSATTVGTRIILSKRLTR